MTCKERLQVIVLSEAPVSAGDWVSAFPTVWEFPKIGDPNIVPQIVGSLL